MPTVFSSHVHHYHRCHHIIHHNRHNIQKIVTSCLPICDPQNLISSEPQKRHSFTPAKDKKGTKNTNKWSGITPVATYFINKTPKNSQVAAIAAAPIYPFSLSQNLTSSEPRKHHSFTPINDKKETKSTNKRGGITPVTTYSINKTPKNPQDATTTTAAPISFTFSVSSGSVVTFAYPPNPSQSAIVNAANARCLGGGGVDGAISSAGGSNLYRDRWALPTLSEDNDIRCPTGAARVTGPGEYGRLRVPYVIHAVGPNYSYLPTRREDEDGDAKSDQIEGDELLQSAYLDSLRRAEEVGIEAVAFSLLSSGCYRGEKSIQHILDVAVRSICSDFGGYDGLKEIHLCAFSDEELDALLSIVKKEFGPDKITHA